MNQTVAHLNSGPMVALSIPTLRPTSTLTPTVMNWPSFTESNICTSNGCSLICGSKEYSLSNVVSTDNGNTQKYFSFNENTGYYRWNFFVPMCGVRPSGYSYYFTSYDVVQVSRSDGQSYGAGSMELLSWKRGTYQGADAFSVIYKVIYSLTPLNHVF